MICFELKWSTSSTVSKLQHITSYQIKTQEHLLNLHSPLIRPPKMRLSSASEHVSAKKHAISNQLESTQINSNPLKSTQIHSNPLKSTQIYSDLLTAKHCFYQGVITLFFTSFLTIFWFFSRFSRVCIYIHSWSSFSSGSSDLQRGLWRYDRGWLGAWGGGSEQKEWIWEDLLKGVSHLKCCK